MSLYTTENHYSSSIMEFTQQEGTTSQSKITSPSPGCPSPVTEVADIIITVVIGILLVVGILGNASTAAVIIKNKGLRTNFNRFLISLCASDLVSACICSPLWVYRRSWGFDNWLWGEGTCKFYWLSDFTTNFTTALHILSFCILRFLALSKPLTAPTARLSRNHFRVYIACLWLASLLLAAPFAIMAEVKEDKLEGDPWPSCSIGLEYKRQYHIYTTVTYSIFIYLPAAIILTMSLASMKRLSKMIEKSALSRISDPMRVERIKQRNKSARTQMQLICASFSFGYIPLTIYHIWASAGDDWTCDSYTVDYWIGVGTYVLLRTSECLNPVMYNLGCKEMRLATVKLIKEDILRMNKTRRTTVLSTIIVNRARSPSSESEEMSDRADSNNDGRESRDS